MKALLSVLALLFIISCSNRRTGASFRVLPADPSYLLRSPDFKETPFPEVLSRYTNSGPSWVDLRPQMDLRIENAYYRDGASRRGLEGFLGTEIARYGVQPKGGLRLIDVESKLARRPSDQPPVQQLLPVSQARHRKYRFFYAVVFRKNGEARGSVLLGAQLLADPDSVCGGQFVHCTVFPELCTVSIEMEIVVNGAPRAVAWGSLLASVAARPRHVQLMRVYSGRLTPVEVDPSDPDALRLPLLPGDHITWD